MGYSVEVSSLCSVCDTRNIFFGTSSSLSLFLVHVSNISLWRKCVYLYARHFQRQLFHSCYAWKISQIHIYINKYVPNKHSLVCDNFSHFHSEQFSSSTSHHSFAFLFLSLTRWRKIMYRMSYEWRIVKNSNSALFYVLSLIVILLSAIFVPLHFRLVFLWRLYDSSGTRSKNIKSRTREN